MFIIRSCFHIGLLFLIVISSLRGQTTFKATADNQPFFDSIQLRIDYLQNLLDAQKNSMDASIYFTKKELEKTMFIKTYEEFVLHEELDAAISLTSTRIEDSRRKKDQVSVDFYIQYEKRWYEEVRLQRLRYQKLFAKEKNFRKEFNKYIEEGTLEGCEKAKSITALAMKYAIEQGGHNTTLEYLEKYAKLVDAKIFDLNSPYDLDKLTSGEKHFNKVFLPLVSSDSIHHIEDAGEILEHCIDYSSFTNRSLSADFYNKQRNMVATAISDYYDRLGSKVDLSKLTDRAITLRLDTLNPYGVFKWGKYIIVIDYMNPQSSFTNVRRGEAIIKTDIRLVKYINLNKLGVVKESDKMGYTFLIPYFLRQGREYFLYDKSVDAFQFMVCYTMVVSEEFTRKVIKYLPPIQFIEEINEKPDVGLWQVSSPVNQ